MKLLRRAAARVRRRPRQGGRQGPAASSSRPAARWSPSPSPPSTCIDEFNLPVRNALAARGRTTSAAPGSLLRVHVDPRAPADLRPARGARRLPGQADRLRDGACPARRWSAGCWRPIPRTQRDILLSGWIRGDDRARRKRAAAVATTYGKGKLVLLGFRAQHRAQTPGDLPVPLQRALLVHGQLTREAVAHTGLRWRRWPRGAAPVAAGRRPSR